MGNVTNDNVDVAYLSSIASRQAVSGTGAFRNGALTGGGRAVFGEVCRALTSFSQGGAGGSYEAQGGETLQGVAAQLWGDAGLWYRLAEANGLSASATLVAGQRLTIPTGVVRSSNSAATFKPYDPAEALGSLSPTNPRPTQKGNKCGALGAILMIAIAVAVTALTRVPFAKLFAGLGVGSAVGAGGAVLAGTTIGLTSTAAIAGGVAAGVAGSVASQAFGVAAGIQDKFSWKGVALAGISAGVGSGLAGSLQTIAGSAFLGDAARGALGSVIGQGIGMATGLQSKFDFAGVAVAGVVGGVAGWGARHLPGQGWERSTLSGTASAIAGGAARSLLTGTDFGDNILAALPEVLGSTIGNLVASGLGVSRPRLGDLSGLRASTPLDGPASQLAGEDWVEVLKRFILMASPPMSNGVIDEFFGTEIIVNGRKPVSLKDAINSVFDQQGYRISNAINQPREQVTIRSAPRGVLGEVSNFIGGARHYLGGLQANSLRSVLTSGGNTGRMLVDGIGNASHALTGVVEQAVRPLYQDNDDMFSAQARAQNNARHPFLLDPNHVPSNAEKRGLLAAAVVGLVGARGAGARGVVGVAEGAGTRIISFGDDAAVYTLDDVGLTLRAEGTISGPHVGRGKR